MADIVITPALVVPSSAGKIKHGVAGAAVSAGSPVYIDADDGKKIKPAEAAGTSAKADVKGLAVNSAGTGQPVAYITEDIDLDLGVTVGSGTVVVLSETAGKLCPDADVNDGRKVVLGVGKGGNKINFKPLVGGAI